MSNWPEAMTVAAKEGSNRTDIDDLRVSGDHKEARVGHGQADLGISV